jgi:hypothetical protein
VRWLLPLVAGCSFEHGALTGNGGPREAGVTIDSPKQTTDAKAGDARPADATMMGMPDANSTCLATATQTIGGHHYFATAYGTWQASQNACASFGGHLVKIETMSENQSVTSAFGPGTSNGYFWIGLYDPSNTDVYVWADMTPLSPAYNGFPGNTVPASSSNCVDSNGTWDVFGCTASHIGVCECE